ncbi:MAG: 16S rRNA (guanine(527)-N(7))-methyltransferase RsmG [Clostridia bacterium]|nr:16S rRNA (guanine(527)-N(7))-methyltransferase RsmG [Clostridia bacterium]
MDKNQYISTLLSTFENNGISDLVTAESAEKLYLFSNLLVETNKITNLTAITDEKGIILKHFVDCASISRYIPTNYRLIDVGCGAGFPSLPLAIIRPDIAVVSLDSTGKKIDFVNRAAANLKLDNITAVCARAEEFVTENREMFDVCTSRAVARLNILSELCLPLVKVGGLFIAMKSNKGAEEYAEAQNGITKLGATLKFSKEESFVLESDSIARETYVFKKGRPTPKEFPRKYAQILKKPL